MNLIDWKIEDLRFNNYSPTYDYNVFNCELVGNFSKVGNTAVNMQEVFDELNKALRGFTMPSIKRVIFNDPATIIIWSDNTKTVVKAQNGEPYDKEKGFVMAYLKKQLGNDNTFNKEIHKWVTE